MLWRTVQLNRIDRRSSILGVLLTGGMILAHPAAQSTSVEGPQQVEVFMAASDERSGWTHRPREYPADTQWMVYRLDGIHRLEQSLSQGLSRDPTAAQAAVRARLSQRDPALMDTVRQTAVGLMKLIEYRIDRYPAIVFDGQAVVYGVIPPTEGLRYYRQWRDGTAP